MFKIEQLNYLSFVVYILLLAMRRVKYYASAETVELGKSLRLAAK